MTTSNTYKFYLDGEWRESSSGETIEIPSPYLHEVIGQVQAITRGEVDEAIASAKEAQKIMGGSFSTRSRKVFI